MRGEYRHAMDEILLSMQKLEEKGLPREDIGMLLPLGMETKVVFRSNLRNLIDVLNLTVLHGASCVFFRFDGKDLKEVSLHSSYDTDDASGSYIQSKDKVSLRLF